MSATPPTPPAATPPPAGPPAAAGPKQTLSIIGFVLGLVAVVFGFWVALIGVGAGIAGLIVSRKAKKDEPGAPSWMHTIGLIASIVGLVLGVVSFIIYIVAFVSLGTLGTITTY